MVLCMLNYMCRGVCGLSQSLQWCSSVGCKSRVSPVASQCGADSTKFLQWHSSVGLFQLSFCSGAPVYPTSISWVAQWYPSVHWVNQWHSSVHWTSQCTLAQGKGTCGSAHIIRKSLHSPKQHGPRSSENRHRASQSQGLRNWLWLHQFTLAKHALTNTPKTLP